MQENILNQKTGYLKIVSLPKFLLLNVVTIGIYQLFWVYRTWEFIGEEYDFDFNSARRTVFTGIYIGPLFWYILRLHNVSKRKAFFLSVFYEILFLVLCLSTFSYEKYFIEFIPMIFLAPLLVLVNKLRLEKIGCLTIKDAKRNYRNSG